MIEFVYSQKDILGKIQGEILVKRLVLVITQIILITTACNHPTRYTPMNEAGVTIASPSLRATDPSLEIIPSTRSLSTPHPSMVTPSTTEMLEGGTGEFFGNILFIFGDGFDYRHYEGTRKTFERAGYQVQVASNTFEAIEGFIAHHGFENNPGSGQDLPYVKGDLLINDIQIMDYDAIVLISDTGILTENAPEVQQIVLEAANQGLVIAAQEYSIYLLADSGMLEGKKVTSNPLICKEMEVNYAAICTLMPVQRDSGIVTADPTMSSVSFANAILTEISTFRQE